MSSEDRELVCQWAHDAVGAVIEEFGIKQPDNSYLVTTEMKVALKAMLVSERCRNWTEGTES